MSRSDEQSPDAVTAETTDRRGGRERHAKKAPAKESDAADDDSDDEDDTGDSDTDDGKDEPKKQKFVDWARTSRGRAIIIVVAISLIVSVVWLIFWYLEWRKWETTTNAYLKAPIARVSPGVAGHVARVLVVDDQMVAAGQPILELSMASFDVAIARAQAELDSAEARLLQTQAAASAARAMVAEAAATARARGAEAESAATDYARYRSLSAEAVAEQQVSNARGASRTAAETAAAARLSIETQRARVGQSDADVIAARAGVALARTSLDDARLRRRDAVVVSPIAGRVTQFDIEPGDYVSSAQSLAAVVGPARWVEANFKEGQLRLMRRGDFVEVTIDAWSGFPLTARIDSFQSGTGGEFSALPPQNATSNWVKTVQRVPTRIRFSDNAFSLFPSRADVSPGMSVTARVKVIE